MREHDIAKIIAKTSAYRIRSLDGRSATMCLLCSLRKMVAAKTAADWQEAIPLFYETVAAHDARLHPDAAAAKDEQARLLATLIIKDVMGDEEL